MSTGKRTLGPYQIFSAASLSGTATNTSLTFNIQDYDNIAIQFNATGTPNGTFAVQGSCDHTEYNGQVTNAGNWIPITLSPAPALSGAATQILINMDNLAFNWLRVVYTNTSSTGTLDGFVTAKAY